MARPPRLQFPDACYHAYHRGNRRELIFLAAADYACFERYLFEAVRRSEVKLFNWKLMPNHFHLLVETPKGNLAEFMQRLLTRYAMYFNRRYALVGHVFQGRYGSIICDKEAYFLELIRYIQLNAYRTKGAPLAEFGKWHWSSHRYFMMPASQWPEGLEVAFREALTRFGNDLATARIRYAQFLADGLKNGNWEDFYQPKDQRFLGDDAFVTRMKERLPKEQKKEEPERRLDLKSLVSAWVSVSGLSEEWLPAVDRAPSLSKWRLAFLLVGRRHLRLPIKDLAAQVERQPSAISHALRRASSAPTSEVTQLLAALDTTSTSKEALVPVNKLPSRLQTALHGVSDDNRTTEHL